MRSVPFRISRPYRWRANRRIDVDTNAIVQQVVDVLLKHSPSPAVHLEVLGRRWLALARNESVTNITSSRYATSIAEPMTCVCFQCGMVNHRSNTHVITVRNVTRPRDCRAYRVFRYYIRRLQRKERERIGDDVDENEVNSSVFLCNPCDDGVLGANVYACTACKTACGRLITPER
jgi:hypothetical protein